VSPLSLGSSVSSGVVIEPAAVRRAVGGDIDELDRIRGTGRASMPKHTPIPDRNQS
jgi:hypothetical protein